MNIVYGVSGEGLGHVFEAIQVAARLRALGHQVKVLTYGERALDSLAAFAPTRIEGINLVFDEDGMSIGGTTKRNLHILGFFWRNWSRLRREFRPEALCGNLDLAPVRSEIWGGFVFICMSDKAPPLQEFLDVLPEHLAAYQFDRMVTVKDVQVVWPVNWKTALDAFLESMHVQVVHPEILPIYDDYFQQWDLYGNGMSRMLMRFAQMSPRYANQKELNAGLQAMLAEVGIDPSKFKGDATEVRAAIQRAKLANPKLGYDISAYVPNQMTDDWAYYLFPNVTLNIHPEGALVQRFRPHPNDPEQFIYDVTVLVHPIHDPAVKLPFYMGVDEGADCSGKTRPPRRYLTPGDGGVGPVLEQDGVNLPPVQKGMHSRGFRGARFGEQEQRLRHYHRELDRYLAGEKW